MIRAGTLTHRLEVQRRDDARTAVGSSAPKWTPIRTVSAAIEPISAREAFLAAQAQVRVSHRITIRYFEGLTAGHQFVETRHGKVRTFAIASILDVDERHVEHQILALEAA